MQRMSYIESNLLPDEKIMYQSHRHWIVFWHVVFWACIAIGGSFLFPGFMFIELVFLALVLWVGFVAFVFYHFSEIAVTNMRVIVKTGWITRNSTETMIQNIASIQVDQPFFGRIFNYGTITILDRGNLRKPYLFINNPIEFHRAIQLQIDQRYPAPKTI